ncbi:MAG: thiamine diphosphokinase [Chloroflexota bacterium]|nr:thiamine diphosphokinase [Chloroflexota bacterium]
MTDPSVPTHAAVVPNGPGRLAGAALASVRAADLVIAADGGARRLLGLGIAPHYLVGDLDSLPLETVARLVSAGCQLQRHPADKDATDTELAIALALDQGATDIDLVGATGGARLDHSLANVLLLAADWPASVRLRLVEPTATALVVRAGQSVDVPGAVGAIVALLPLAGPARGITTRGLQYALAGEDLAFGRARGVSNVMTAPVASISLAAGILLVIHQHPD